MKEKLNALRKVLSREDRLLILINPDPDAMAGSLCLALLIEDHWGVRARIVHGGVVGRASNRGMVSALDIPLWTMESIKVQPTDGFVFVDTQPGFANNSAPEGCNVVAVIDHHPSAGELSAPLTDLRVSYGAVTTIAVEYLVSAGMAL